MRLRLATVAICFAMPCAIVPAGADEAETIADIKAAMMEVGKAYSDHDVATIKRMTTSDHFAVARQFRKPLTVTEQIDTLSGYKREPFDFTDMAVRLLGDAAAFVTYENSYKEGDGNDGKPLPPRVFVSQVWLKQDGAWRQLSYQETPITPP